MSFKRHARTLAAAAFVFLASGAQATPRDGSLDPSVGDGDGYRVVPIAPGVSRVLAGRRDVQGNLTMVGLGSPAGGPARIFMTRLRPDSSLDTSFGVDGFINRPLRMLIPEAAAIDSQGRTVVVGSIQNSAGVFDFAVERFRANGSPDTSFGNNGLATIDFAASAAGIAADDFANAIAFLPNANGGDKIVVGGAVLRNGTSGDRDFDFGFAMLDDSGHPDANFNLTGRVLVSFDIGGARTDSVRRIAVDRQGRIVAIGNVSNAGEHVDIGVTRVLANGNVDASFCPLPAACPGSLAHAPGRRTIAFDQPNSDRNDFGEGLAFASDGTIYIGATTDMKAPESSLQLTAFALAQLADNGTQKPFVSVPGDDGRRVYLMRDAEVGIVHQDTLLDLAVDGRGNIVIAGEYRRFFLSDDLDAQFAAMRIDRFGNIDPGFGVSNNFVAPATFAHQWTLVTASPLAHDGHAANRIVLDRDDIWLLGERNGQAFMAARLFGGDVIFANGF